MLCKIVGGTNVPGNEKSWERKFLGTKGPGNESSKFPRTKRPGNKSSLWGLFVLGNERSWARKVLVPSLLPVMLNYAGEAGDLRRRLTIVSRLADSGDLKVRERW